MKKVIIISMLLLTAAISPAIAQQKRYTNADFYKNGVFQKDVAKQAIKELVLSHGELWTPQLEEKLNVNDFGLGDYEHVGIATSMWFNDETHDYFAMTIYLLPNQMLAEHIHYPITEAPAKPAKYESWKIIRGWVYNFSEIGDATPGRPQIPASIGQIKCKNFKIMQAGETAGLKKLETWHFLMAGNQGAIIDEYGVHNDGRGTVFSFQLKDK